MWCLSVQANKIQHFLYIYKSPVSLPLHVLALHFLLFDFSLSIKVKGFTRALEQLRLYDVFKKRKHNFFFLLEFSENNSY